MSLVSSLPCMAPGTYLIRVDEWMDIWMDGQMDRWHICCFDSPRLDKNLFRFFHRCCKKPE